MLAAADKLLVVTSDGAFYCFGSQKPATVARYPLKFEALRTESVDASPLGEQVVDAVGDCHGYALVLGISDAGLLETARQHRRS